MEDNKEVQETTDQGSEGPSISKEISDFNFLITTLIAYYAAKSGLKADDEGEEWKQGTKYDKTVSMDTPKRIDDAVERAFLVQLKKFSDPSKPNAQ